MPWFLGSRFPKQERNSTLACEPTNESEMTFLDADGYPHIHGPVHTRGCPCQLSVPDVGIAPHVSCAESAIRSCACPPGHDIRFEPKQSSPAVNYSIYPLARLEDKPCTGSWDRFLLPNVLPWPSSSSRATMLSASRTRDLERLRQFLKSGCSGINAPITNRSESAAIPETADRGGRQSFAPGFPFPRRRLTPSPW